MRWFTHKSVALAAALSAGASLPLLAGAALGSILPDAADMAIAGRNRSLFQRIHRGTTHWAGWYLLLLVGAQFWLTPSVATDLAGAVRSWLPRRLPGLPPDLLHGLHSLDPALLVADALTGIALGALSHILLDALNPSGVPLSPLGGQPRLRLARIPTGSLLEMLFLAAALGLLAWQVPGLQSWISALLKG